MGWKEYCRLQARRFFDKTRGNKVALRDFPFLFAMLSVSGWSGMLLSGAWFLTLLGLYRKYWTENTIAFAVAVLLGFGLISLLSMVFGQAVVDSTFDRRRSRAGWEIFARARMSLLLILFAVTCSVLIWGTGGMYSPFTPFYIMVFTLALTRCRLPHPGTALVVLFVVPFALAGVLAEWGASVVDNAVAQDIKRGTPKDYADFFFALTSMIVPYASTYYAESRAERQRQAAVKKRKLLQSNEKKSPKRLPRNKT